MLGMQVRQCVLLAKWCLVQIFSIPLVAVGCSFLFPMAHGAAPPEPIFATSQVRHHGCHFSMCKHGHPWDCDLTAAVPCLWRDQRCHACDLLRLVVVKLVPQDVLKCNVLIHCSDGWDRTAQVSSARSPRSPSQPWLNRYPTGVWLKHGVLLKSRHFFDQNYRILFSYATTCCILLRHMAYMIKILRHAPIVSSFKVAMLCMDPHYRTLRGLLLLIQKDAPSLRERLMMFMDTGWWFGTCAIFPHIGNTYPSWLINIFQRGWNHQPGYVWCLNVHQPIRLEMVGRKKMKKEPCGRSSVLVAIGFAHDSQMVRSPPASDMAAVLSQHRAGHPLDFLVALTRYANYTIHVDDMWFI